MTEMAGIGFAQYQELARLKQARTLLKAQQKQRIGGLKADISRLQSDLESLSSKFEEESSALDDQEQAIYLGILRPPSAVQTAAADQPGEGPQSLPKSSNAPAALPNTSACTAQHIWTGLHGVAQSENAPAQLDSGSCSMQDADADTDADADADAFNDGGHDHDANGEAAASVIPISAWPSASPLVSPSDTGQHQVMTCQTGASTQQAVPPSHSPVTLTNGPSAVTENREASAATRIREDPALQAVPLAPANETRAVASAGQALFHYTLPLMPAAAREPSDTTHPLLSILLAFLSFWPCLTFTSGKAHCRRVQ